MVTLRLEVDARRIHEPEAQAALAEAARILLAGGLVALPTETVYGLGANALNESAVAAIFAAKGRPAWDPLIVHVADEAMLARVADEIPASARKLMAAFWPGPLTLLLPRSAAIPDTVTAGRPLVGVRMPAHPVALELLRLAGVPIAAPSANRFGHVSPTTAEHVIEDLDGRIDAVIDSGPTAHGVESTVVDATGNPMIVYRPGAVTLEQLRKVAGAVELFTPTDMQIPVEALPSPGVGIRHYAPRARLVLLNAGADWQAFVEHRRAQLQNDRVGVMLLSGLPGEAELRSDASLAIYEWGRSSDLEGLANRLFAGLRYLDLVGCTVIVCPTPSEEGIGAAIHDRLRKAARAK
jgi:L-threonylcarbamoyladenylate synthase